jgi:serine phosphatase RsbU (regulator of sigma subunit)
MLQFMLSHFLHGLAGCLFFCLHLIVLPALPAQSANDFFLSADTLKKHTRIWLTKWKYHAGDNPEWANPNFSDSAWEIVGTTLEPNASPKTGWNGIGWFRLHLTVDSLLWQMPLIVTMRQAGSAEIYLDGKLIYAYGHDGRHQKQGRSGRYHDYATLTFDQAQHVFAIRYSNARTKTFHRADRAAGFYFLLGHADPVIENAVRELEADSNTQMFFTTLALAFGLLHLFLFLFSPESKSNLYLSILLFFYAANIFFDYQCFLAVDLWNELKYLRMQRAVMPATPIFALLFIYSLFELKIPKQFWLIATGIIIAGFFAVLKPVDNYDYVQIFLLAMAVELLRVIRRAIRNRKEGAWIIACGFIILFFFSFYDILLDLDLIAPINDFSNGYPAGFLGLLISMSIYLARDFAKRNETILTQERHTQKQEVQHQLLEADNARKTKELEEARALQLSMLPKTVPQLPHLEIAVYMKTAAEVGGDYYDFHLAQNGELTVVIGDATGHGMKAGTMVTVTKSLFHELANTFNLPQIFEKYTRAIKRLNLRQLFMAMALVKIKDHCMIASSAGMPPILIYRAATQSVEELALTGMPLGSFTDFPYQQKETSLNAGDTIILMSDGFPEMFNDQRETLDYPRAREIFAEAGQRSPQEIIDHLARTGGTWANGQPQEDDVTFVVMKLK